MELVHSWAKEFVTMPKPERVAEILDAAGLPVDGVSSGASIPATVVVGHVLKIWQHPNADRLKLTTVDVGDGAVHKIVCGAPNVKQGQKVPVALIGTTLPNGMLLKQAKIRGEESHGMICAEDELGLGGDHTGIIVLPESAVIGRPAAAYLKGKETVYTVAVMPNRSDALSIIGLARDIAAAEGKALPKLALTKKWAGKSAVKVSVLDKKACSLFCMQHLTNITIKPSPAWMQDRLTAAGVRPINNVVDITNYVLLELGRPLHAFDAEKLAGKDIIVRRAKPGEKFMTLDGVNRTLTKDMLVVADAKGPVALAGVMGGEDTAVTDKTTEILLEAAVFDSQLVYDTSHALGLVSESSQRFAKGVDREMTLPGLRRAVELLIELAGAKPVGAPVVVGQEKENHAAVRVSVKRINAFLGSTLTAAQVKKYLASIGCTIQGAGDALIVTPPSWRHDIVIPEDISEEVARLYGYNNIPRTVPKAPGVAHGLPKENALTRLIRDQLVRLGAHEHVGYAYVPEEWIAGSAKSAVKITNPLSKEQAYLRTSLIPGLYAVAEQNSRRFDSFRMFEIGKEYGFEKDFIEEEMLGILVVEKNAVRVAKGMLGALATLCGVELSFGAVAGTEQPVLIGQQRIGGVHIPSAAARTVFKLPSDIAIVMVHLASFAQHSRGIGRIMAQPIPLFPPVKRDLALWVASDVPYAEIEKALQSASKLLTTLELFDVFTKDGRTSYAFHLLFSDPARTLEAGEVETILDKMKGDLKKKFAAEIR